MSMGIANDFLEAFYAAYPQAKKGDLSLQELNELIQRFQVEANTNVQDDFDGLTSEQMHHLLYQPFTENCVLQIKPLTRVHLDHIPLYLLMELLMKEIEALGRLKLTANGNLPVRVCKVLVNQRLIEWKDMDAVKSINEDTVPYLRPLKQFLLHQGIVKKEKNALSLTAEGRIFIKQSPKDRFRRLFFYFGHLFNWKDLYDPGTSGQCGQLGWSYSLVLLHKYGQAPRKSDFYSSKLIRAFEKDLATDETNKNLQNQIAEYYRVYAIRFFECFASWFGLVKIERKQDGSGQETMVIKKTELFDRVFKCL